MINKVKILYSCEFYILEENINKYLDVINDTNKWEIIDIKFNSKAEANDFYSAMILMKKFNNKE